METFAFLQWFARTDDDAEAVAAQAAPMTPRAGAIAPSQSPAAVQAQREADELQQPRFWMMP